MKLSQRFFDTICASQFEGHISPSQEQGMLFLISAIPDGWDRRWAAYLLATALWETNHTMQPVREAYWLSEGWRKAHLSYWPYYGRGFVQLTWKYNYVKFSQVTGVDLVKSPDLALNLSLAAQIAVYGMEHGSFTGKGLGAFLGPSTDFIGARAVINGKDHAQAIAAIAEDMLKGVNNGSAS